MGTLTPVLGTLTKTLAAVQTISSAVDTFSGQDKRNTRAQQELAMKNLQESQSLTAQQAAAKAQEDRDKIALEAKQSDDARRKALKRAMARQNVRFGASGTSRTGSGEAVLLGLYNDSQDEKNNNDALDQLRFNTIDSGLYNTQQNNILQRTQLAEQQRLQNAINRF